ncbi:MAG: hypothetical protein IJ715_00975 [Bacilli bacterium]|nr:hypothetical protein [Bacilli bacterium]
MEDLKKYVFYVIINNGDIKSDKGYAYGVYKNKKYEHQSYLETLIGIEPYFFENVDISFSWAKTIESFVENGNITFVNSSISFSDSDDLFLLYLPSYPNLYQLNMLESFLPQFEQISFDIGVYGELKDEFREDRINPNYNSYEYLKKYIFKNKSKLESKRYVKEAI